MKTEKRICLKSRPLLPKNKLTITERTSLFSNLLYLELVNRIVKSESTINHKMYLTAALRADGCKTIPWGSRSYPSLYHVKKDIITWKTELKFSTLIPISECMIKLFIRVLIDRASYKVKNRNRSPLQIKTAQTYETTGPNWASEPEMP